MCWEVYHSSNADNAHAHAARTRTGLSLLPTDVRHWWPIVKDVFGSEQVRKLVTSITTFLFSREEYIYLSIDATIKCAVAALGQESWRTNAVVRNMAPFDDSTAIWRVLTVRGRTGAVLGMLPISTEKAGEVSMALASAWLADGLWQVRVVASDNANMKLYTHLRRIMPGLQAVCLDPIHLAITYECLG